MFSTIRRLTLRNLFAPSVPRSPADRAIQDIRRTYRRKVAIRKWTSPVRKVFGAFWLALSQHNWRSCPSDVVKVAAKLARA
jgi:hypothetical protein